MAKSSLYPIDVSRIPVIKHIWGFFFLDVPLWYHKVIHANYSHSKIINGIEYYVCIIKSFREKRYYFNFLVSTSDLLIECIKKEFTLLFPNIAIRDVYVFFASHVDELDYLVVEVASDNILPGGAIEECEVYARIYFNRKVSKTHNFSAHDIIESVECSWWCDRKTSEESTIIKSAQKLMFSSLYMFLRHQQTVSTQGS